jgi:peptidyl-prolyl cis-trans isomerase C
MTPRLIPLLLLLLVAACSRQEPVVAAKRGLIQLDGAASALKVNGEVVPESLVAAYARKRDWDTHDPGQREQVYDQLGELIAVAQEANKRGLLTDAEVAADLELERLNRLSGLLMERAQKERPITDEELQTAYNAQLTATGGDEFHVVHVLFESAERANLVIAALATGTSIDDVLSATAGQPGVRDAKDLGWVRRPQLPPALADAVAALAPGSYTTAPVATDYGFHVAFLREKRAFQAPAYERVRDGIRKSLETKRALDLAAEIKKAAKVEH